MTRNNCDTTSRSYRIACGLFLVLIAGSALTGCRVDDAGGQPLQPKKEASVSINNPDTQSAVDSLKRIRMAESSFSVETSGDYGKFYELVAHKYLSNQFSGEKPIVKGYVFTIKVTSMVRGGNTAAASYTVNADPVTDEGRHFFMDRIPSFISMTSGRHRRKTR